MKLTEAHHKFSRSVERMVGHELAAARYFGVEAGDEKPISWLEAAGCHSIDYGLDMEMRSGEVFGIIWSGHFWQYGVDVIPSSLTAEVNTTNIDDMTNHPNWAPLIGQKIAGTKVHWSWSGYANEPEVWFPQEVELVFASGFSVLLCASDLHEGALTSQHDSITVVFGKLAARHYGIGPCRMNWSHTSYNGT